MAMKLVKRRPQLIVAENAVMYGYNHCQDPD